MPLQMASGKLFHSPPAFNKQLRGVLYSNLSIATSLETEAGRLVPMDTLRPAALVYEMTEHMEHDPAPGVLASRGVDPYLQDYAAIVALGLNVVCTPDANLQRRLINGPPGPAVHTMPCQFVTTTFDHSVSCRPRQAEEFTTFVRQLMGLRRKAFVAVMRAIRTYVTAIHRLGDSLDVAYTLLVSSIEPLAQTFDGPPPSWDDYPEDKRSAMDKALSTADDQTQQDVRATLLKTEHIRLARRFRLFVQDHLESSFFREEAVGKANPVGRAELDRCLIHAYDLRSRYLHGSKELPRTLTLGLPGHSETIWTIEQTLLTFEGLGRVVRHVIKQFVLRQGTIDVQPSDYSNEEPGTFHGQLAPRHWICNPVNLLRPNGIARLFGFCKQMISTLGQKESSDVTAMGQVVAQVRSLLPNMKKVDRRSFLVLYRLYNRAVPIENRIDDTRHIFRQYAPELEDPSIESMLLALLTGEQPGWTIDEHRKVHDDYFQGGERAKGTRMDARLEIGLTLELAERYRADGDADQARQFIAFAVENCPGNPALMRFEEEFDAARPIAWRKVMCLPVEEGEGHVQQACRPGPARHGEQEAKLP